MIDINLIKLFDCALYPLNDWFDLDDLVCCDGYAFTLLHDVSVLFFQIIRQLLA